MDNFFSKVQELFKSGHKFEEEKMTFAEIVNKNHYPLVQYSITTEDGYILKLFRIPNSKDSAFDHKSSSLKQPILFQHGIFDSSDGWICNSAEKCFPFILADLGYDVWLSNSRGINIVKLMKNLLLIHTNIGNTLSMKWLYMIYLPSLTKSKNRTYQIKK